LVRELHAAGLQTDIKLLVYDGDWDNTTYAEDIFEGESAALVHGASFHCMRGAHSDTSLLASLHRRFPTKEIHVSECSSHGPSNFAENLDWNLRSLLLPSLMSGARSVGHYNLVLDAHGGAHKGGCADCRGVVSLNNGSVTYNEDFYGLAHVGMGILPGAVVLQSTLLDGNDHRCMQGMAFKNPDGSVAVVMIVWCVEAYNWFTLQKGANQVDVDLPPGVHTFLWPPLNSKQTKESLKHTTVDTTRTENLLAVEYDDDKM
ncbi:hypothetical protein CYMTET_36594, partial [Cymbomonas tetramitiformis]